MNHDRNVLVMEETPTLVHTLKRRVYICNNLPCGFLDICSGLYCHSPHFISLCLSAIALFWHSCFFSFSRWLKYSHSCPLFSSLSIYPCILFPPSQFFFPLSRVLAPPPHCLSLSPLSLLCSGCWHASSAWQSQDYFIYLLFFPPIFSLNMRHCSEWPYRSWAVLGEPVSF